MQEKTATISKPNTNTKIWKSHLKAWEKSGLSKAAYCREQNLSYYAFMYWKKKLDTTDQCGDSRPINFVPVLVGKRSPGGDKHRRPNLTVEIGSDYIIGVHEGFSPDTLMHLITTLRSHNVSHHA